MRPIQRPMFLLVPGRNVGAHLDGHHCTSKAHVSTEISIDLGQKNYPDISLNKKCSDRQSLYISFILFPDSGLYLLNVLDFYFHMASHWKPAIHIYFLTGHVCTPHFGLLARGRFRSQTNQPWPITQDDASNFQMHLKQKSAFEVGKTETIPPIVCTKNYDLWERQLECCSKHDWS